jgi:hypothetical protein
MTEIAKPATRCAAYSSKETQDAFASWTGRPTPHDGGKNSHVRGSLATTVFVDGPSFPPIEGQKSAAPTEIVTA